MAVNSEKEESMRVDYCEHSLETIVDYFIKGYELKGNKKIHDSEYFIDPTKGKIIIKLYIINKK